MCSVVKCSTVNAYTVMYSMCSFAASNDTEMEQAALLEEYLLQKKIGDHPNVVRMLAGGMYKGASHK